MKKIIEIEKEKFHELIKKSEIKKYDYYDELEEEEFFDDILNNNDLYKDYVKAVEMYKTSVKIDKYFDYYKIDITHDYITYGLVNRFLFDINGKLKEIHISYDDGYEISVEIKIKQNGEL